MGDITGWKADGILFLAYTAGLMFVLRFFFGGVVHKFSPFAVLTVCAVLAGTACTGSVRSRCPRRVPGRWEQQSSWPSSGHGLRRRQDVLLADDAGHHERAVPAGRGVADEPDGRHRHAGKCRDSPRHRRQLDQAGPGAALQSVSYLAIVLVIIFGALLFYFSARGGYKPVTLTAAKPGNPSAGQ